METTSRTYPRVLELAGTAVELRLMSVQDREDILRFAAGLSGHDLLFLRRDITQPSAVDGWLDDIAAGYVRTLLARVDGELIGYATLHRSELRWSEHVAELRMVVGEGFRGKGLGRRLTEEIFALALDLGVEKMMARMTTDQKGAIATFEGLGFHPEALMRDHVKDLEGNPHDLIVMSHDVASFEQTLTAYGVQESLGG